MSTTTVATATPAAASTEPDTTNEPWTMEFDLCDEDHCLGAALDTHADYPDIVKAALAPHLPTDLSKIDHDDLRDAIDKALIAANDALEDTPTEATNELVDELETAAYEARPHDGCQCGLDSWTAVEEDWFNSAINASSDSGVWAIFDSGDTPRQRITDGAPTVRELWKALNSRDGWQSVSLTWDPAGRRLNYTFGSYPSNWHGYAVALTEQQAELARRLEELSRWVDEPECFVVTANPHVLEIVLNLWGDEDREDLNQLCMRFDGDPQDAVVTLSGQLRDTDPAAVAAMAALSRTWTGTVDELRETSLVVAAA